MKKVLIFLTTFGLATLIFASDVTTKIENHGDKSSENVINIAVLTVLEEIVKTNAAYRRSKGENFFKSQKDGQTPRVTIISCSDSRVHKSAMDNAPENDLFSIRNIGNQITTNEGSVAYGIEHLHTPILLIAGHSRCGAIKAAMSDYSGENSAIRREVDTLSLSIIRSCDTTRSDKSSAWIDSIVGNVNRQVSYALQTYSDKVKTGELVIIGAVYDLANDLGKGYGKFEIININGESNPEKLRENSIMKKLEEGNK